jgi:putative FmdB family regulatory protein
VPTYEYQCDRCNRVFELRQRISEPPLTIHDDCGGSVRRLLSPAPFILKGGGWYVTDYPSESRKKAMSAEKSSSSSTDKSEKSEKSDKSETSEKKSDKADKPAASPVKSEGKSSSSSTSDASSSASKPSD